MIGGIPTTFYLDPTDSSWFDKDEGYVMRLDSKTHRWQSEGNVGLPRRAWSLWHYPVITGQLQLLWPSSQLSPLQL